MCIRCRLNDDFGGDLIFLEPEVFDTCIIGVGWDGRVTYDAIACVELFEHEFDCSREKAHGMLEELASAAQYKHRQGAPAFVWVAWDHIEDVFSGESSEEDHDDDEFAEEA